MQTHHVGINDVLRRPHPIDILSFISNELPGVYALHADKQPESFNNSFCTNLKGLVQLPNSVIKFKRITFQACFLTISLSKARNVRKHCFEMTASKVCFVRCKSFAAYHLKCLLEADSLTLLGIRSSSS